MTGKDNKERLTMVICVLRAVHGCLSFSVGAASERVRNGTAIDTVFRIMGAHGKAHNRESLAPKIQGNHRQEKGADDCSQYFLHNGIDIETAINCRDSPSHSLSETKHRRIASVKAICT
jgi:hypothetical protein